MKAMKRFLTVCMTALLLCRVFMPIGAVPEVVYKHASKNGSKRVALTFDDGPHPKYTPQILDILSEYGVEATFFMVGMNAQAHPELVQRIKAAGHEIGNHTHNHYHPANISKEDLQKDIIACSRVLEKITGEEIRLFRPPEGVCSGVTKAFCREMGYTVVMWSVDTRDWAHPAVADIYRNVKENTADGAIILMHDFIGKKSPTPEALRRIIPMLQEAGYEFVTVSRLLDG